MSRFDYVEYDNESFENQRLFKLEIQSLENNVNIHINCPRSRALIMTKLEEAYMWIGKGIRNDQIERSKETKLQEQRNNS